MRLPPPRALLEHLLDRPKPKPPPEFRGLRICPKRELRDWLFAVDERSLPRLARSSAAWFHRPAGTSSRGRRCRRLSRNSEPDRADRRDAHGERNDHEDLMEVRALPAKPAEHRCRQGSAREQGAAANASPKRNARGQSVPSRGSHAARGDRIVRSPAQSLPHRREERGAMRGCLPRRDDMASRVLCLRYRLVGDPGPHVGASLELVDQIAGRKDFHASRFQPAAKVGIVEQVCVAGDDRVGSSG